MGQINCKYHPQIAARWACPSCHINFCPSCVKRTHPRAHPQCPVCGKEVDSLGVANAITPFWRRIPQFFLYPLRPTALIYILALTAVSLLVSVVFVGFIIELLLLIAFVKYGYVVLEHSAKGYADPPSSGGGNLLGDLVLPFKQVMLLFCFSFANYAIYDLVGNVASHVFYILVTVALPASTMVLAVEYSFFKALNPVFLATMIRRIGVPYFILFFFLLTLSSGSGIAFDLLRDRLPEIAYVPVLNFLLMYFGLIMFSMMGYVIYQYHEQLGFPIEVEPEGAMPDSEANRTANPALQEIEILLQEGKFTEALNGLEHQIKLSPGDLELRDRLHKLLISLGDKERTRQYDGEYLSRLLAEKKATRAMEVFRECQRLAPDCRPANPAHVHDLAVLLRGNGEYKLVLALLNNFHNTFPNHPDIPRNYLLAAQIMAEKFNQDENARKILDYLIGRYPDHALAGEIRGYLNVLERMSG